MDEYNRVFLTYNEGFESWVWSGSFWGGGTRTGREAKERKGLRGLAAVRRGGGKRSVRLASRRVRACSGRSPASRGRTAARGEVPHKDIYEE